MYVLGGADTGPPGGSPGWLAPAFSSAKWLCSSRPLRSQTLRLSLVSLEFFTWDLPFLHSEGEQVPGHVLRNRVGLAPVLGPFGIPDLWNLSPFGLRVQRTHGKADSRRSGARLGIWSLPLIRSVTLGKHILEDFILEASAYSLCNVG